MATDAEAAGGLRAGRDALARGAWEAARSEFERTLAGGESAEALEGLSWAAWWSGDPDLLFDARERAYRAYRDCGDRCGAARMAMWMGTDSVDFRGEFAVASGWLARARRLLEGLDETPEQGWLCVHEAEQLIYAEDTGTARTLGAEAAALGRRLGLTALEMMGLSVEGLALVTEGDIHAGLRRLDEAVAAALGGEFEERQYIAFSCCFVIYGCERARDYDRAAQWCRKAVEFAERAQLDSLNHLCRAHYAGVLVWHGAWDEAEAELLGAAERLGSTRPALAPEAVVRLAELRRRQGRHEEAADLFAQVDEHPLAMLGRAEMSLDRGDPVLAKDLAERMLREAPATSRTQRAAGLEILIRALAALGREANAGEALDELRAIASAVPTDPLRAAAGSASGAVEAARGQHEAARRSYEDAAYLFQRSGAPLEAGRARLELARVLAALERAEHAAEQAGAAATVFERIGARAALQDAEAFLAGLAPADGAGSSRLTGREREILGLVAQGLGDRAIAEALVISEHTVHRHISNILAKLGCRSRSAAVAEGLRGGLI